VREYEWRQHEKVGIVSWGDGVTYGVYTFRFGDRWGSDTGAVESAGDDFGVGGIWNCVE